MSEAVVFIIKTVFVILDLCFFFFSVVGNSIVIYVVGRDKSLKSKSSYHILSVASIDLVIGLFGIPLALIAGLTGAPTNYELCLLTTSFILAVFAVSMFSLLAVSVDRYWAVCYPMSYHVKNAFLAKSAIALCWISGAVLGFLPVFGWNSGLFEGQCDLRVIADLNYLLFLCIAIAFTSTTAIVILYALIYRAILKQAKKRQEIVANTNELVKNRKEINAANTLAMIVGTFIVLWMPAIIVIFIIAVTGNRDFPFDILGLVSVLVHVNPAVDPIIYAYRMKNVREAFRKVFGCFKPCRDAPSIQNSFESRSKSSIKTMITSMNPPG